jgi:hypothetical protein
MMLQWKFSHYVLPNSSKLKIYMLEDMNKKEIMGINP